MKLTYRASYWLTHLCVLLWGFTAILGKLITLSPLPLVMWRMLFSALVLGILVYSKKIPKLSLKDSIILMALGILLSLHWISFYASVKTANASVAVVCITLSSVFVAMLSPIILKERFRLSHFLLGLIMLIGIWVIFGTLKVEYRIGLYYGVIAALLVSVFSCYNKIMASKFHPYAIVFWEMIGGFLFLFIVFIINTLLYKNISYTLDFNQWHYFFIFVVFCTVLPLVISTAALQQLSAFVSIFLVNLEPIYGILLAALFLHENQQLSHRFYWGALIILSGIFLQIWWERSLKNRFYKNQIPE